MKRSNIQNIGEVLSELLHELQIEGKIKEVGIINAWSEVLGDKIGKSTSRIFIKNRVLFVYLKSPVVRNELMMLKSSIIKALNEKAGESIIDNIVLR